MLVSSQLRVDSKKQLLKLNSQLFCKRGLCPCLMDHSPLLASLNFFGCYFEAVRPLVLSLVKQSEFKHSCELHSPYLGPRRGGPALSTLRSRWPPGKQRERGGIARSDRFRKAPGRTLCWGGELPAWAIVSYCTGWEEQKAVFGQASRQRQVLLIHGEPGFAVTGL